MKKFIFSLMMVGISLMVFGQDSGTPKKTRDIAKTDVTAVSARKISVQYTEGLKAYYSGNISEALKIFNGIILDNPKHDASYFMLARIYTDQQNVHEAVNSLQQAIKIDKNNIWYKVDLADLYMQMEEYSTAAKLWEQICKEKDNNEYYLYSLSEAYLNMKKLDKVIDTYNRMEEIIGHNDEITRVKVSIWLYMNKVKEAVGEYDKLIKMFPHNADYYIQAGNIYQSNGMPAQAIEYYKKAQELDSNDPKLNFMMANYWEQQGSTEQQMQCLTKVFANSSVSISEKNPFMRNYITKALHDNDHQAIRNADALTDQLIATHPESGDGYAFKASLCTVQKKYAEAASFFEKALGIDNSSYSVWEDYCYALSQTGQWQDLLKYENDLMELFPQNARILCNLGLGHLQKREADKAIELLMQAKTYAYEKEQLSIIYEALSEAYQQKGDSAAAEQWRAKSVKK